MSKRSAEDAASGDAAKQHHHKRSRTGIHAALPTTDDAWRRKLERAKEANVRFAKTRQVYAKVKARTLAGEGGEEGKSNEETPATMHPERLALLDADGKGEATEGGPGEDGREERRPRMRGPKRPTPFQKAREEAEQRKAEAEARRVEFERRMAERDTKREERARHQKAMARARRVDTRGRGGGGGYSNGDDNQRRKLGRESEVLLDRVRRMMGK